MGIWFDSPGQENATPPQGVESMPIRERNTKALHLQVSPCRSRLVPPPPETRPVGSLSSRWRFGLRHQQAFPTRRLRRFTSLGDGAAGSFFQISTRFQIRPNLTARPGFPSTRSFLQVRGTRVHTPSEALASPFPDPPAPSLSSLGGGPVVPFFSQNSTSEARWLRHLPDPPAP